MYYAKLSFLFSGIIAIIKIPFTKKLANKELKIKYRKQLVEYKSFYLI